MTIRTLSNYILSNQYIRISSHEEDKVYFEGVKHNLPMIPEIRNLPVYYITTYQEIMEIVVDD